MAINEALVIFRDVAEFTPEAAEFIVLEVAKGASLAELHECHEDLVPNPIVVRRWRRDYPAFDAVMREAEEARAEEMAYEVVRLSDEEDVQAAVTRNRMEARKWLAGRLDEKYSTGGNGKGKGVTVELGVRLTDEQLMAIAAGGAKPALEGESERVSETDA